MAIKKQVVQSFSPVIIKFVFNMSEYEINIICEKLKNTIKNKIRNILINIFILSYI